MEEIFRKYYRELVYYGLKFIDNRHEVEDIVMDVFIAFDESKYPHVRPSLYIFVKQRCLDYLKTQKRRNQIERSISFTESIEFSMLESDVVRDVSLYLDKLSPESRKVIEMYYIENKRCTQIAKELAKPASTIRSLKRWGVNSLIKLLKKQ